MDIIGYVFNDFHYKVGEDDDWEYYFVGDGSGELFRIRTDRTVQKK